MFAKLFPRFFLIKFNTDVVVFVLRGFEIQNVSGAFFGFVRTMLGEFFHFLIL